MESDMDSTMLACIAFACSNLESLEISMCKGSINRISGDELVRFVADKRCLTSLKMDGCSNLGAFVLCSTTLSTLWLSDLHSLSKMVFNLPNLSEISLDFSRQENDSTDVTFMMDGLGRSCPRLQNIHIDSLQLSHFVVLSLTAANLSYSARLAAAHLINLGFHQIPNYCRPFNSSSNNFHSTLIFRFNFIIYSLILATVFLTLFAN